MTGPITIRAERFANVQCAKCKRPVQITNLEIIQYRDVLRVTVKCHGEIDICEVYGMTAFDPEITVLDAQAFRKAGISLVS